ncbi:HGxxPAAW family protein [Auraticoccus cholistanensis]|uniref:HGxxPAAW family protein n=1 Tax=Auraticoccus cholistanensis TaxID=2656650 RepID=UPI001E5AA818|nr:HGxxPAAW family protein [Auraticoccus cholistanensis]
MHSHPKYHHGRSPAAWAGVLLGLVGFVVGSIGFLVGPDPEAIDPNWLVIGIGAAIVVAGMIATVVLRAVGLGND